MGGSKQSESKDKIGLGGKRRVQRAVGRVRQVGSGSDAVEAKCHAVLCVVVGRRNVPERQRAGEVGVVDDDGGEEELHKSGYDGIPGP